MFDVLARRLGPPPQVFNSDGDEVVFHTMRFPLVAGATAAEVEARLGTVTTLRREAGTVWNWIGLPATRPVDAKEGLVWNVALDDGNIVLGNIELKDRAVVLSISSAKRAERGRTMLSKALAGLVGTALTEIQTIEQMRASLPDRGEAEPEAPVPPEVATEMVHSMLDRQYRAMLDEPLPILGNRTPRAAARSARGRRELAAWLKGLENRSSHAGEPGTPMASYDFGWLWRELDIERLRS